MPSLAVRAIHMCAKTCPGIRAGVIFRPGAIDQVAEEVRRLGCKRALVLSTPGGGKLAQKVQNLLGALDGGAYCKAVMHTPVETTLPAVEHAQSSGADCLISIGGGSAIGLSKAIALRTDLPQIVIPTTYSGSECTAIGGELKDGVKQTQTTLKVLAEVIIYDIDLTLSLPAQTSITSGFNAIAHAVEALYSSDASPITDALAVKGIQAMARALPTIARDPSAKEARSDALFGAYCCGACLGAVKMHLHHKLCHTIGGSFGLPHSETHTVVLPHAVAYNAPYTPEAMQQIKLAIGASSQATAAQAIYDLIKAAGGPTSLKELGFKEQDIETCVDTALKAPYPNPAPLERGKLLQLIRDAYEGKRPA